MNAQACEPPPPSMGLRICYRMPVVMRAVLSGIAMGLLGSIPWLVFAGANQRHVQSVPWAVLPMSLYLWGYCRYAGGSDGRLRPGMRAASIVVACGADASFWIAVVISAGLALAAVWAYARLAHVARIERSATIRATALIHPT